MQPRLDNIRFKSKSVHKTSIKLMYKYVLDVQMLTYYMNKQREYGR